MSLLLTFFIMLVSMSEIKEEQRYQAMAEALRQRFGHDTSSQSLMPGQSKPRNSQLAKLASLGRARRANTMNGGDKVKAPVGEHPRVAIVRSGDPSGRGVVVYFQEGSDVLNDEAKRKLHEIVQLIGGKPQKIEVRGHTSTKPLPPNSPYKSHWDLSYARARIVTDFLIKLGIDSTRIRIEAAADNEPVHIGNDLIMLRLNPRVEVKMVNELVEQLRGTPEERRARAADEEAP